MSSFALSHTRTHARYTRHTDKRDFCIPFLNFVEWDKNGQIFSFVLIGCFVIFLCSFIESGMTECQMCGCAWHAYGCCCVTVKVSDGVFAICVCVYDERRRKKSRVCWSRLWLPFMGTRCVYDCRRWERVCACVCAWNSAYFLKYGMPFGVNANS